MGRKITIDSATLMNKGLEVDRGALAVRRRAPSRSTWSSTRSRSSTRWSRWSTARSSRSSASPTCGCRSSTRSPIRIAGRRRCRRSTWRAAGRARLRAAGPRARSPAWGWPIARCEATPALPVVLNAANEVAVAAFLDGHARRSPRFRGDRAGDGRARPATAPARFAIWTTCAPIDALGARRFAARAGRAGYELTVCVRF